MISTIDPKNVTDYNRDLANLQVFAVFCVCVAGKNADQTSAKVASLLRGCPEGMLPLDYLTQEHRLHNMLVAHRVGQYGRIEKAIKGLSLLDLTTCTLQDLVAIHGISYKTACFFLLHTRDGFGYVVLDTHVLKYLVQKGHIDAPKDSPSNPDTYDKWSRIAHAHYRADFGDSLTLAQIDLLVWKMMSGRGE